MRAATDGMNPLKPSPIRYEFRYVSLKWVEILIAQKIRNSWIFDRFTNRKILDIIQESRIQICLCETVRLKMVIAVINNVYEHILNH